MFIVDRLIYWKINFIIDHGTWVKCGPGPQLWSMFYPLMVRTSAGPHFTNGHGMAVWWGACDGFVTFYCYLFTVTQLWYFNWAVVQLIHLTLHGFCVCRYSIKCGINCASRSVLVIFTEIASEKPLSTCQVTTCQMLGLKKHRMYWAEVQVKNRQVHFKLRCHMLFCRSCSSWNQTILFKSVQPVLQVCYVSLYYLLLVPRRLAVWLSSNGILKINEFSFNSTRAPVSTETGDSFILFVYHFGIHSAWPSSLVGTMSNWQWFQLLLEKNINMFCISVFPDTRTTGKLIYSVKDTRC